MQRSLATLRPVCPADEPFLLQLYASTRAEELAATDWTEEQKHDFCVMQFTAQAEHYFTHYPTAERSVILLQGQPVGRLYVDRWQREIRIMDLALLPQQRGLGIGTQMLQLLQAEAQKCGKRLSIHVEKFNPALQLYQRLGFQIMEDKGIYWLMSFGSELVMS
jgi:ribosomal protein S18 acetylase RimI-like enzyme